MVAVAVVEGDVVAVVVEEADAAGVAAVVDAGVVQAEFQQTPNVSQVASVCA